jgi:hypothetical protein
LYTVTDPSGNKSFTTQRLINVIEDGPCFTSVKELSANSNVSIYPNPSKGLFTVASKGNASIAAIQAIDVMGKTVYTKTTQSNSLEVDLTQMNKGLYMVIIKDENGNEFSSKVVVE